MYGLNIQMGIGSKEKGVDNSQPRIVFLGQLISEISLTESTSIRTKFNPN